MCDFNLLNYLFFFLLLIELNFVIIIFIIYLALNQLFMCLFVCL